MHTLKQISMRIAIGCYLCTRSACMFLLRLVFSSVHLIGRRFIGALVHHSPIHMVLLAALSICSRLSVPVSICSHFHASPHSSIHLSVCICVCMQTLIRLQWIHYAHTCIWTILVCMQAASSPNSTLRRRQRSRHPQQQRRSRHSRRSCRQRPCRSRRHLLWVRCKAGTLCAACVRTCVRVRTYAWLLVCVHEDPTARLPPGRCLILPL